MDNFEIKRNSSVIYASALEKIRLIYPHDAALAGNFAIAYIEQLLTDNNSFEDNWIINSNLTELIKTGDKNNERYAEKVEKSNSAKYDLAVRLAGYIRDGLKQKEMAVRENKSESWISGKIRECKNSFPEVFTEGFKF